MIVSLWLAACGSTPTTPPAPPAAAPPAAGASLSLAGTVVYDGVVSGQAVFVSVKDPSHPGPPLAAKKLAPGPFPLAFTLTDADLMGMGGARPVPATVALTVRLDGDGDAMTKDASEPIATVETAASATGLTLTLATP